jgi:preprotein translocase subunit SecA
MNRGDRALQHGLVELTADEAREYANIQERKMRAQAALMGLAVPPPIAPARAPRKIGRNDPCHCGSGKKFKKCHGG